MKIYPIHGDSSPEASPPQSRSTCVKLLLACVLLAGPCGVAQAQDDSGENAEGIAEQNAEAIAEDSSEENTGESTEENTEEIANKRDGFFGLGWLDSTQSYSSSRADALASQLDRFFGVERSDLEAAYSSLRLIPEVRWHENEGFNARLRLRGRLHLPRINERLSLILSEDEGEGTSYYNQNPVFQEAQSTRVNMEVNLSNKDRYRFDFRVGLRSSLKLRTSVRFRYEAPLSTTMANRLSETVYFIDGKGFGSFTQYQLDRSLSDVSLLRWSTEYRHEENLEGDEWSTSFAYQKRLSNTTGASYFARIGGNTDDDFVALYQVGMRWRGNVARPWLFWEFSPGYQWEKLTETSARDGSLFAAFSLEMAIGRQ